MTPVLAMVVQSFPQDGHDLTKFTTIWQVNGQKGGYSSKVALAISFMACVDGPHGSLLVASRTFICMSVYPNVKFFLFSISWIIKVRTLSEETNEQSACQLCVQYFWNGLGSLGGLLLGEKVKRLDDLENCLFSVGNDETFVKQFLKGNICCLFEVEK